ncbi:biotin/lipoate A/B protein ligase, variant [Capsaspora owczarzaki ATCC 30864]|uniref:Biotin/lipoate A/B protein ligase, variant n=1 Tax=Capsaspora owczarzaki (strain ATCC 30864) TaxID=595528 RepID=A0A0D2VWP5_CAPO3|nr:biotin/lipoate A/B protein ligase, variant [Capsaspora owczarzaki ATCC 30864]
MHASLPPPCVCVSCVFALGQRPRLSTLLAPIVLLTGHSAEVTAARFNPAGTILASASLDKSVLLWDTASCKNFANFSGNHTAGILDLQWTSNGERIVTASIDKSVGIWDAANGDRIRRYKAHQGIVNACATALNNQNAIVSGSDDRTTRVWDPRVRAEVHSLACSYPVTSVAVSHGGDTVYAGGLDNVVKVFDLRKPSEPALVLEGHADTITSLSLSPNGNFVLTNAMDNTVRIWDVRPYCPNDRCSTILTGAQHSFEKTLLRANWSPDGNFVAAGSADRFVYVWNANTRALLYRLPGHSGSVNDVTFHPKEPIIASGASDKKIYLGELDLS